MQVYLTSGDGIEALQRAERPIPTAGPREVLVRMKAVALNYRDLLVVRGVDAWKPPGPRVPVSDGVGVVVAVGAQVARFSIGDRVAGTFLPRWIDAELDETIYSGALGGAAADGVMAEYRVFDESAAVRVPAHLSDAEAATLPVAGVTAWHAVVERSRVQPGERVLIQGTGGVSLFALIFARALGAETIVLSSSDAKLARARELGAHELINYRDVPEWSAEVLKRTGGRGVDHVIEVVGGENLNRSLRAVRISGTISFIGLIAGLSAPIDTYRFVTRNVRIHGIETGSRAMFEAMNRRMEADALRPVLDRTFSFEELPQALAYLAEGAHFGKVVVTLPCTGPPPRTPA